MWQGLWAIALTVKIQRRCWTLVPDTLASWDNSSVSHQGSRNVSMMHGTLSGHQNDRVALALQASTMSRADPLWTQLSLR